MEELKAYYTAQAESQPDPSIKIQLDPAPVKKKMKTVFRVIVAAAVIALLTATALATGSQWLVRTPKWVAGETEEDGNWVEVETDIIPFSAKFRAYIDAGNLVGEEWWHDGIQYYSESGIINELQSIDAVSDFFGVQFAYNPLIPTDCVESVRVLYKPAEDSATVTMSLEFTYDIEGVEGSAALLNKGLGVSVFNFMIINDVIEEPTTFGHGYSLADGSAREFEEEYYTSPVSDIEALLLITPMNSSAIAHFSLNGITYMLETGPEFMDRNSKLYADYILGRGEPIDYVGIIKEIIDAYHP